MNKKIVIKIGSNVLRKTDGSLDRVVMQNIVEQISLLREDKMEIVLVSSGAMAAGKDVLDLGEAAFSDEVQRRQVSSAIGQVYLMRAYQELFDHHSVIVGQVLITKLDLSTRRHYLNVRRCIEGLHTKGIVPIVNENDSTAVEELMFTDNDEIAGMLASMIGADELIICTNVDGIFDGDPQEKDSKVLNAIAAGENVEDYVQAGKSLFGRGGMGTKIATAQKAAKLGIKVKIINGRTKDSIKKAICEEKIGTTILPLKNVSTRRRWLAFADQTRGVIIINNCLEKILRDEKSATSILPVGIIGIKGSFKKNDLIGIVNEEKGRIGVGVAQRDSEELKDDLGKKGKSLVIHYDHMHINV